MSERNLKAVPVYRANFWARIANAFVALYLKLGFKLGTTALLTVKGIKTGVPRTNPVLVVHHEGKRYLVAAYGVVNWVRNIRASHEATLFHDRKSEVISVTEISPNDAAPILKCSLSSYPSYTRSYFAAKPDSPVGMFLDDATNHPVFEIADPSPK